MAKRIIAAWVEQIVNFDTREERDKFITELQQSGREYDLVPFTWGEGVTIRVRKQYNKNRLWKHEDEV